MGWSCAAKASLVASALSAIVTEKYGIPSSNGMPGGGFWETSRKEHADGAITGTVWKTVPAPAGKTGDYASKAGSFKITAEGKIERFPGMPKEVKAAAEAAGAAEYTRLYEAPVPGLIRTGPLTFIAE